MDLFQEEVIDNLYTHKGKAEADGPDGYSAAKFEITFTIKKLVPGTN